MLAQGTKVSLHKMQIDPEWISSAVGMIFNPWVPNVCHFACSRPGPKVPISGEVCMLPKFYGKQQKSTHVYGDWNRELVKKTYTAQKICYFLKNPQFLSNWAEI